ncbi:type II toxin-antitoxin system RelE/ParE family toxin [Geminocystis herdmanii]|uniref:type II toxin-antitoxin system RelE/ParE family toxin n=1 Tax=Geminocystis herdmanii TaxID=669359 RepID=UPI0003481708|nr:type II toxin-antitoxin system RelE/ParE family toxin [Geminocystis herdmanii]
MRIFKNKSFDRFTKNEKIKDQDLWEAVERANKGLISADLGGGLIKQRIARKGQGKSSGFRSIIIFKADDRAFFVYGFAKNQQDNINEKELIALKKLSNELLSYSEQDLLIAIEKGILKEIKV